MKPCFSNPNTFQNISALPFGISLFANACRKEVVQTVIVIHFLSINFRLDFYYQIGLYDIVSSYERHLHMYILRQDSCRYWFKARRIHNRCLLLLTAQRLVIAFFRSSPFYAFLFSSQNDMQSVSYYLTNVVQGRSLSDIISLLGLLPSIILLKWLLWRGMCLIILALFVFKPFKKLLVSLTLRKTSLFTIGVLSSLF